MGLKALRLTTNEAPKAAKSDIALIEVEGQVVTDYNTAVIEFKNAEAAKKLHGAKIQEIGIPALLEICLANPDAAPSSVKLRDELGSTVLVIGQDRYGAFDSEVAEPVFQAQGAKVEDFAQFVITAKFDDKIFLAQPGTTAGAEGVFSTKIFKAYAKAIDQTTAQLVRDGLLPVGAKAPLYTTQVAQVKPDFHQARWKAFLTVEAQQAISKVCPNVVALKPVVEGNGDVVQAKRRKT